MAVPLFRRYPSPVSPAEFSFFFVVAAVFCFLSRTATSSHFARPTNPSAGLTYTTLAASAVLSNQLYCHVQADQSTDQSTDQASMSRHLRIPSIVLEALLFFPRKKNNPTQPNELHQPIDGSSDHVMQYQYILATLPPLRTLQGICFAWHPFFNAH